MAKKSRCLEHHIVYAYNGVGNHKQEDIKVKIFPSEHYILTLMQRRGKIISKGFIDSLKYFIWEHETKEDYTCL